jgi:hypothetical protein
MQECNEESPESKAFPITGSRILLGRVLEQAKNNKFIFQHFSRHQLQDFSENSCGSRKNFLPSLAAGV